MARLIELDDNELETITEMLREYKASIERGDISGFGQTNAEEIADTDVLIKKLERATW
jgi:hypothetical protein